MNRRWLAPALFGALCLAQIAAPASMIARYEATLRRGTVFKVRTAPVDPVDAFRGRYVWFRLDLDPVEQDGTILGGTVWVSLEEGPDGFAKVTRVSTTRPPHGSYVGAQAIPADWRPDGSGPGRIQLVLPHDRYYMEESKAPRAELAARRRGRTAPGSTWVTIRVRDGVGAVERLWIDGVPVEDYVRRAG